MEVFNPVFEPKTPSGKMNFVGAVRAYFNAYTRNCNEDTKDTYIRDYNERIFPLINPALAIEDYEDSTIEALRVLLQRENQYDEVTLRSRYDHLLTDPCDAYFAAQGHGACSPLWGAGFKFTAADGETVQEKLLRVRKSLTISEELQAKDILLRDPGTEDGALIGLAIMFLSGTRNAEACGLNFGDLTQLRPDTARYCLRVYKTTQGSGNQLKLGGKTSNAPRYVPIPKVLSEFLLCRRAFLSSKLTFPCTDDKGVKHESVDTLPMVCRGNRYAVRGTARDLTEAGRALLRTQLAIPEEQVSGINVIIQEDMGGLGEKDATTYLFRRNMATQLTALGFTASQIQYYMGHRLENSDLRRSDFTNEDMLYEMSVLLDQHPLNDDTAAPALTLHSGHVEWKNTPEVELEIKPQEQAKKYYLKVTGREICDTLSVSVAGKGIEVAMKTSAALSEPDASGVNITKAVHSAYRQKRKP